MKNIDNVLHDRNINKISENLELKIIQLYKKSVFQFPHLCSTSSNKRK